MPEKENDLALYGIGRQGHLKRRDATNEVLRQLTLAIQCRTQLAFGQDDESGGDLEVQAEALLVASLAQPLATIPARTSFALSTALKYTLHLVFATKSSIETSSVPSRLTK